MKIDEIPQGGAVILTICKENQTAEITVGVAQVINKGIVLNPIEIDGRVLNLEGSGATVQMVYEREGQKPLIWRNISYRVSRHNNYPIIILFDKRDGVVHNRRKTFRLEMDMQGTLNMNEKVVVHDISGTGISFYVSEGKKIEIGSPILIKFSGNEKEITVTGKVVRSQPCEERTLYGCSINASLVVDKFISEEQGRRARKGHR